MNNPTKTQHMVSQLIQREFAYDEEKLKTYGIKEIPTKHGVVNQLDEFSISTTMYRDYCYELPLEMDGNGQNINYIEKYYRDIETKYKIKLEKLIQLLESKKSFKEIKNFIEKEMMKDFLMFYFRTYQFIRFANNNKNENDIRKETFKRLCDTIYNDKYINGLMKTITNCYKLHILEAPSENLLLSDSFISTASIDYKGWGHEDPYWLNRSIGLANIMILIPISSKFYLLYTDDKKITENYIKLYKTTDLDFYNSIIYRNAYEFTVGKNLDYLKHVYKTMEKYALSFTITGGFVQKSEIWCDSKIDDKFYSSQTNELNACGYTYYKNFTIEKNIAHLFDSMGGYKMLSRYKAIKKNID